MSFLLDTNVVSEWMKPHPNPGVVRWLQDADEDRVFLSVVTLTELRYGIDRMPLGARRSRLDEWLQDELPLRFESRIVSVDESVASACGTLIARSEVIGHRLEAMDAFIAATAQCHSLTIVTRNARHFAPLVESLLNPWS